MRIKFLGASGTVTGSCYLLTALSGQSVLIDCGLFQGIEDTERLNDLPLQCDCSRISGMVLTHAHLDHCGRVPTLLPQGFTAHIWMTRPTCDITEISLLDSAKVNKEDKNASLYDKEQVEAVVKLFHTVEYDTPFSVGDFSVTMRDAGHILGSASLEIIDRSEKNGVNTIVFSGDLGNSPQDLIAPTARIDSGDAVVMESTYGDHTHPHEDPSELIQSEIDAVEASGGTLLIPAFSIERSQELLHRIWHLKKEGQVKQETPIFFDSPMAEHVTKVFEKYPQYLNEEFKQDFVTGNPFHFPGLRYVGHANKRNAIGKFAGPKVIIEGSGMMTGGRIVHHARQYLPITSTRLLIVGYQAEGTTGNTLLSGRKVVTIEGVPVSVNASVHQTQAMSSHADQPKLLAWLGHIEGVKKVFLTHGENGPRGALAEKIKADIGISDVLLPTLNQEIGTENQEGN